MNLNYEILFYEYLPFTYVGCSVHLFAYQIELHYYACVVYVIRNIVLYTYIIYIYILKPMINSENIVDNITLLLYIITFIIIKFIYIYIYISYL